MLNKHLPFTATDKWGFTPLHEAAQKGRTQLCSLLLAHGADPTLKNQEGQTPLDLSTAEDVKCLLQDAMTTNLASLPTASKSALPVDHQPSNNTPAFISPSQPQSCAAAAAQINASSFSTTPGTTSKHLKSRYSNFEVAVQGFYVVIKSIQYCSMTISFSVASDSMSGDQGDSSINPRPTSAQRNTSISNNPNNATPAVALATINSSTAVVPKSSSTTSGSGKDKVMLPSGASLAIMPPAGAAASQNASNSVVPVHVAAGIGVGFPMPHPGDGSMDFSKTEMVTPETSLNMSMAAFLAR